MRWSDSPKRTLCYVTDRRALGVTGEDTAAAVLLERIALVACAGVDWIQIREKDLAGRDLANLVRDAIERAPQCRILVNDRLDVAIAARAAGVHLGTQSLPLADVVKWRRAGGAPAEFLIGRSCHALEEALEVERGGADYILFGPVFATPSKAEYGAPQGIAKLVEVCARVRIPVLAIGGITAENAGECFRARAAGIAAIRMFQDAADVAGTVSLMRRAGTIPAI